MAIFTPMGSNLGIDLNNQSDVMLFALGTHTYGSQDTEWVYLQANSSISARTMIAFTVNGSAGMASGMDILSGLQLATAQTTVSVSSYFWAAIKGIGLTVLTTGSCTAVAWNSASGNSQIMLAASGVPTGVLAQNQASSSGNTSGILAGLAFTDATNQTATSTYTVATLSWPAGAAAGL
jgi:hypothetical protein